MEKRLLSLAIICLLLGLGMGYGLGYVTYQSQVELNRTEIIRFYEPNEMNVTARFPMFYNLTTFVWTPNNPQSNAILAVYGYCEFRSETQQQSTFDLELTMKVNELQLGGLPRVQEPSAEWKLISFLAQPKGLWINPNQNNYTVGIDFGTYNYASFWIPKYVRNVNIIIEVIDGIP